MRWFKCLRYYAEAKVLLCSHLSKALTDPLIFSLVLRCVWAFDIRTFPIDIGIRLFDIADDFVPLSLDEVWIELGGV